MSSVVLSSPKLPSLLTDVDCENLKISFSKIVAVPLAVRLALGSCNLIKENHGVFCPLGDKKENPYLNLPEGLPVDKPSTRILPKPPPGKFTPPKPVPTGQNAFKNTPVILPEIPP